MPARLRLNASPATSIFDWMPGIRRVGKKAFAWSVSTNGISSVNDPADALLPRARDLPRQRAPLHGRGGEAARRALAGAGLRRSRGVEEGGRERVPVLLDARGIRRRGRGPTLQ